MSTVADPHNLQRFVDAQDGVYGFVLDELRRGRKETHWMWFVFPQLKGLQLKGEGQTDTAQYYGIGSLQEARAYLEHPVLGPRLRECALALTGLVGSRPIGLILGPVDALKLRSSMTLFRAASKDRTEFEAVLNRYYGGEPDELTLQMLRSA